MLSRQNGAGVEALAPFFFYLISTQTNFQQKYNSDNMLTLIAESKTMSARQKTISYAGLSHHIPIFEAEASEIIKFLSSLDPTELAMRISISNALATKAAAMIYEFPNKSTGSEAIMAFTGEVFRGLDISTLDISDRNYAASHLMIISSLYGLLRTDDIIKPYRLDFNAACAPDGNRLAKYWRAKVTTALKNLMEESGEREVLDLLPAEASRCIDWNALKDTANIMKVDFKAVGEDGNLKTPHSGKLKEMRGKMARTILSGRIDGFDALRKCHTAAFAPDSDLHTPQSLVFVIL